MTFIHAPLLQPLRIGAMTIQNRFCAGPLTLPSLQGPFGEFSPDGLAYFEARAKGALACCLPGPFTRTPWWTRSIPWTASSR